MTKNQVIADFGLVFPETFDNTNPVFIAWEWHLSDLLEHEVITKTDYTGWLNPLEN